MCKQVTLILNRIESYLNQHFSSYQDFSVISLKTGGDGKRHKFMKTVDWNYSD